MDYYFTADPGYSANETLFGKLYQASKLITINDNWFAIRLTFLDSLAQCLTSGFISTTCVISGGEIVYISNNPTETETKRLKL